MVQINIKNTSVNHKLKKSCALYKQGSATYRTVTKLNFTLLYIHLHYIFSYRLIDGAISLFKFVNKINFKKVKS